jgi:hypothetical protein
MARARVTETLSFVIGWISHGLIRTQIKSVNEIRINPWLSKSASDFSDVNQYVTNIDAA